jgi:hypothetical protein
VAGPAGAEAFPSFFGVAGRGVRVLARGVRLPARDLESGTASKPLARAPTRGLTASGAGIGWLGVGLEETASSNSANEDRNGAVALVSGKGSSDVTDDGGGGENPADNPSML